MMTLAQGTQFTKNRSFMISLGYRLTEDRRAIKGPIEITAKGKFWISTNTDTNQIKKNEDLGRLLRIGLQ